MQRRRTILGIVLLLGLGGCGTPVADRPTPPPVINITPGPTQDINATATYFADQLRPTQQPPGLYIVRDGDTLESIAFALNTTVDEITMTNRISDANVIYIGQPLIIPSLISTTETLSQTLPLNTSQDLTPTP